MLRLFYFAAIIKVILIQVAADKFIQNVTTERIDSPLCIQFHDCSPVLLAQRADLSVLHDV
ncbi:hypothetical protein FIS3754_41200 [Fischerella sp. NIES-3754]|nr:hypothetical protein FIS3754_41200 [Fischerella sp. NIES-3754]BCX10541.1 MAG: hypothetical protein KatS3mg066_4400 [Fischerella sp.]